MNRLNLSLLIVLLSITLLGCQTTKSNSPPINNALINNNKFVIHTIESQSEIFELNEDIKSQLDQYVRANASPLRQAKKLLNFLMNNGDSTLAYQSGANLVASDAFYNLNANCLSLSILAYSLAEHLGLSTQFQRVHIPEYWDQSQGYSLLTGHVNLVIKQPKRREEAEKVYFLEPTSLTVDFDPNSREQHFKTSKISKDRITAMFYNNKGAMHMIKAEYDLAYSYFRAAIQFDKNYSGAWGNLGILYRLNHMHDLAEQTYQHALLVNPENNTVLGNTALLYRLTNRIAQAEKIEASLESKRRDNPYYMIVKGNEALAQDELNNALRFFNEARKLDKSLHDSYFGLAKVYYYRGNLNRAESYLKLALKNAEFTHDKKRYQGKLAAFKYLALRESS
ncbi:MAG: hypothetical protein CMK64_08490 [Pseudoalteromonas sp.]|nr:hypothetical protein [Pseudoalteromonas sp.]|tara:strand:+ start:1614 stop:2798 length:1185 start_codon:yes stop_codon:yes gene_type:complete